jgi:Uma2 family endonuclease
LKTQNICFAMKEDIALAYPVWEAETLSDYEVERGKPMPNRLHGIVETHIAFYLAAHYRNRFDIATELTFDLPDKPATPDVVIMEKELLDYFDVSPRESDPPLVAIEIISPSQGFAVFKEKAERYFAFGVRSYWLVEPHFRMIHVFSSPRAYTTFNGADVLHDPAVGVEMPLSELFA